ncbi:AraC family ligand binding domain-containing protein [Rhizorhabdus histidinilytica]
MTSALSYAGAPSPPHRAHHPLAGFAPTTLRSNRVFESNDVEYTRDQISIILQPHLLSPKGRWQGTQCYVDHFPIGRVGLGTIHFGNMQVHVPSYAHYLVALCLRGNATIRADRKEYSIGGGSAHIMIPGEEMLGTFSADCEQFFVRISTEAVRAHTGFRHLVFRKELDLSSPAVMPWLQQVALIAANPRMAQMISNHPSSAATMSACCSTCCWPGKAIANGTTPLARSHRPASAGQRPISTPMQPTPSACPISPPPRASPPGPCWIASSISARPARSVI